MSFNNLFRSLNGKEEEAVTIVDNRDISEGKPNNSIMLTCDHATNDIKLFKPTADDAPLLLSNQAYDCGTGNLTNILSEKLKCLAVMANFSKLMIDPSKPLINSDLIVD